MIVVSGPHSEIRILSSKGMSVFLHAQILITRVLDVKFREERSYYY